jgi:hypothetical protein
MEADLPTAADYANANADAARRGQESYNRNMRKLREEVDQLKAELAGIQQGDPVHNSALANEIARFDTLLDSAPTNGFEAVLLEKLKAANRVLEMIAGLKDEATIGGRVYEQTVDIKKLKTMTLLALRTPGTMIDLDKVMGND